MAVTRKVHLGDKSFRIVVPTGQVIRMKGKCFRGGRMRAFAGAFALWGKIEDLFSHNPFISKLRRALTPLLRVNSYGVHRLELEFSEAIGWDSMVELEELDSDEAEACVDGPPEEHRREKWQGRFLPIGVIEADLTDIMTIVVDIQPGRDGCEWGVFIRTMYPGHDIGELSGNMTEKTGAVFLDFMNPGESYVENID